PRLTAQRLMISSLRLVECYAPVRLGEQIEDMSGVERRIGIVLGDEAPQLHHVSLLALLHVDAVVTTAAGGVSVGERVGILPHRHAHVEHAAHLELLLRLDLPAPAPLGDIPFAY